MAQINVERKSSSSWMWWLLGLVIVALLIWAIAEAMDRNREVAAVAPVGTMADRYEAQPVTPGTPEMSGMVAGIPLDRIVANPGSWAGQSVSGEVKVAQVVSDRGFWIEGQGERLFVLLNEISGEVQDVNAGQTIRMTDARVYSADDLSQLPGEMQAEARSIARNEAVVLAVDSENLDILEPAA